MLADGAPAWLLAWQEQQSRPAPPSEPVPKLPVGSPNWHKGMDSPNPAGRPAAQPAKRQPIYAPHDTFAFRKTEGADMQGMIEPKRWDYDGCVRREPVLDADTSPPRVVRKVGWQRCLKCRRPFFSEDVLRLRLCSGADGCREDEDRFR